MRLCRVFVNRFCRKLLPRLRTIGKARCHATPTVFYQHIGADIGLADAADPASQGIMRRFQMLSMNMRRAWPEHITTRASRLECRATQLWKRKERKKKKCTKPRLCLLRMNNKPWRPDSSESQQSMSMDEVSSSVYVCMCLAGAVEREGTEAWAYEWRSALIT